MAINFSELKDSKDLDLLIRILAEETEADAQEAETFEEGTSGYAMEMIYQGLEARRRLWLSDIRKRIKALKALVPCSTM
jgi:hypothetical protein